MTEFLKIAALAQAHGLDICPHGDQLAHLPLLAAIPNARMLEYYPKAPGTPDAFLHTRPVNPDGTITVPDVPGMALDPNPDFLKHAKRLA